MIRKDKIRKQLCFASKQTRLYNAVELNRNIDIGEASISVTVRTTISNNTNMETACTYTSKLLAATSNSEQAERVLWEPPAFRRLESLLKVKTGLKPSRQRINLIFN
jgi:hypothetical protein